MVINETITREEPVKFILQPVPDMARLFISAKADRRGKPRRRIGSVITISITIDHGTD